MRKKLFIPLLQNFISFPIKSTSALIVWVLFFATIVLKSISYFFFSFSLYVCRQINSSGKYKKNQCCKKLQSLTHSLSPSDISVNSSCAENHFKDYSDAKIKLCNLILWRVQSAHKKILSLSLPQSIDIFLYHISGARIFKNITHKHVSSI